MSSKSLIFLTMSLVQDMSVRGVYTDLLRKFRDEGWQVYMVAPRERSSGLPTALSQSGGISILGVRTLDIRSGNPLEKGIGQVLVEGQYRRAIRKYLGDVHFDLILYSTPPVTFGKVIRSLKAANPQAESYLLLKDIFPRNAVDLGMMSTTGLNGFLYRFFRRKEKKMYALSDHIGCMSPANVDYLLKHNPGLPAAKVEVAPNSCELPPAVETDRDAVRSRYGLPLDRRIFIYGGNLGRPQDIPFIMRCLEANASRSDCHFLIIGHGTELARLKAWQQSAKLQSVTIMDGLPKDEYDELVRACDAGMIFLDHRFTIPNYPSRLLSYLECRKPVLCVTDPVTDIGRIAAANGYGCWCESSSVDNFNAVLAEMLRGDLEAMGQKGYDYLCSHYLVEHTYNAIAAHV